MKCQNCGSLIPDNVKLCPECGAAVVRIIDSADTDDNNVANIRHENEVYTVLGIPLDTCNQIDMYIAKNNKPKAIRLYKQATGVSLDDAKSFVNNHRVGYWPVGDDVRHIEELYSEASEKGASTSGPLSDRDQYSERQIDRSSDANSVSESAKNAEQVNTIPCCTSIRFSRTKSGYGQAVPVKIYIDEELVGKVAYGKSVVIPVDTGVHALRLELNWSTKGGEDTFYVSPDQASGYYTFGIAGLDCHTVVEDTDLRTGPNKPEKQIHKEPNAPETKENEARKKQGTDSEILPNASPEQFEQSVRLDVQDKKSKESDEIVNVNSSLGEVNSEEQNDTKSLKQPVNINVPLFWVCLSLIIVAISTMLAFGNPSRKEEPVKETPNVARSAESNVNITEVKEPPLPSPSPSPSPTPVSKQKEVPSPSVYSANDITIKMGQPAYDRSTGGYYADVSVINESDRDIHYAVQYVTVNGYQMPVRSFSDVYAGMKCDVQFLFSSDDLKLANIDYIRDVEMCVKLTLADDYKAVIDIPTLHLRTNEPENKNVGNNITPKGSDWKEIYNERGITISARFGKSTESNPAVFNIKNDSGNNLSIMFDDVAINNSMVVWSMTAGQVADGSSSIIEMNRYLIEAMSEKIPANNSINSITFKFSFLPMDSDGGFSTANMFYSDKITLSK